MRFWRLTIGDIRFQWKYGFYALYAIFAVAYLLTLSAVPEDVRRTVATVMIYTDPAAMGLFFMGAIILLEKSQRVNSALAVSPVRAWEYMLAKLLSLALIGILVGGVLAVAGGIPHLLQCVVAILLASFLCSACGLIAAERSRSLNQFILLTVPFELLLCLPPVLLLFGIGSPWLMLHPGVSAVWLIYGAAPSVPLCVLSLLLWCLPAMYFCHKSVTKYCTRARGAGR
jgi:fluoroquinolone transport system permease protein